MRDHRPQATQDLLADSLPGQIQQRALALAELNKQVLGLLPQNAANQCRVANFRQGVLILECGSSSWATRLNYERMNLISQLRRDLLPELTTVDIKINPSLASSHPSTIRKCEPAFPPSVLSLQAAEYLKVLASGAEGKVKKRLESLAKLAK
ncbi:DUF721 domain-containing protein [Veronia pacifica]|uniref:RNA-binding protein n=1 Tax=Veronia pacifica TaxID=1080227 RepID=A0A1C3ELG5_9GAMM|nr:DciA family protein [Veronia pacifica]ODA34083.1 hypothetical protein A8L45_07315 [Veronia pacifica]